MEYKFKRSVHLVIADMVKELVTKICSLSNQNSLEAATLLGMLAAVLEMMKRVNISQEDYKALCADLWKVKESCPEDLAEKLLPAQIFAIEAESKKNEVTYIPCSAKGCIGLMQSKEIPGNDEKSSSISYVCMRCGREQEVKQPGW